MHELQREPKAPAVRASGRWLRCHGRFRRRGLRGSGEQRLGVPPKPEGGSTKTAPGACSAGASNSTIRGTRRARGRSQASAVQHPHTFPPFCRWASCRTASVRTASFRTASVRTASVRDGAATGIRSGPGPLSARRQGRCARMRAGRNLAVRDEIAGSCVTAPRATPPPGARRTERRCRPPTRRRRPHSRSRTGRSCRPRRSRAPGRRTARNGPGTVTRPCLSGHLERRRAEERALVVAQSLRSDGGIAKRLADPGEGSRGVAVQAAVLPLGQDDPLRQLVTKARGKSRTGPFRPAAGGGCQGTPRTSAPRPATWISRRCLPPPQRPTVPHFPPLHHPGSPSTTPPAGKAREDRTQRG